jgi:hypothetical protein
MLNLVLFICGFLGFFAIPLLVILHIVGLRYPWLGIVWGIIVVCVLLWMFIFGETHKEMVARYKRRWAEERDKQGTGKYG